MPKIIKNGKVIGSSPSALSGLLDTDITTPTANQVLAYDNNGKVVNVDLSFKRINFVIPIDAISSGASKAITANDANYTIPNGYKAVSYYVQYCYGSNTRNLNIWSCNLDATGTSTFIEVQNMGSGATTSGATITLVVLFAQTSRVSTTA